MDPTALLSLAASFGAPGLIALACGFYVVRHDKVCEDNHKVIREEHAKERENWRLSMATQHSESLVASTAITTALSENAKALAELSTLLRDRR
jgi:hypothetical protein